MLHKDPLIINSETFQLIQALQSKESLKGFYLVGGTALALQIGHRNSIDIDLFTQENFDSDFIFELLQEGYSIKEIYNRKNTVITLINNIKTDFIRHNYPYLTPLIIEEGITMVSKQDIAAMKVHAITQSGKRLKDFVDIYFLLQYFCMTELIDFFIQKYDYSSPMVAIKALNFFGDIDENIDPPKLLQPLSLKKIIARIKDATLKPNKVFA